MSENRAIHPVATLCRVLGVSSSGYRRTIRLCPVCSRRLHNSPKGVPHDGRYRASQCEHQGAFCLTLALGLSSSCRNSNRHGLAMVAALGMQVCLWSSWFSARSVS